MSRDSYYGELETLEGAFEFYMMFHFKDLFAVVVVICFTSKI